MSQNSQKKYKWNVPLPTFLAWTNSSPQEYGRRQFSNVYVAIRQRQCDVVLELGQFENYEMGFRFKITLLKNIESPNHFFETT